MIGAIIKFLADLFGLVGPLSINLILNFVNETKSEQENIENESREFLTCAEFFTNGYFIAVLVLLSTFLQSIFSNNFNHLAISEGIHLRSALQVRNHNFNLD